MGKTGKLTIEELTDYLSGRVDIKTFVETGTYLGDSTEVASYVFERVESIEICQDLYNKASQKLTSPRIKLHLGDTVQLLPDIVKTIDAPCMWFLDAHQSGPETQNNGQWVPLLNELDIILRSRKEYHDIFVIDDVRLFSAHWDWADVSLESIQDIFKRYGIPIVNKFVKNDRFVLTT